MLEMLWYVVRLLALIMTIAWVALAYVHPNLIRSTVRAFRTFAHFVFAVGCALAEYLEQRKAHGKVARAAARQHVRQLMADQRDPMGA